VSVTASGPFVNTLTVPEASGSTFALLSTAGPSWNSNADNNVGDVFKEPTHTSSENDNLVFTSGSIDFKIDSSTAITLNRIDLDPGDAGDAGDDDVELESSLFRTWSVERPFHSAAQGPSSWKLAHFPLSSSAEPTRAHSPPVPAP